MSPDEGSTLFLYDILCQMLTRWRRCPGMWFRDEILINSVNKKVILVPQMNLDRLQMVSK